jgi:hypothetical protein
MKKRAVAVYGILIVSLLIVASFFLFWAQHKNTVKKDGPATTSSSPSKRPPQFVILAFDGSKQASVWEDTRAFARDMATQGVKVQFSYFISGVFFLTPSTAYLYHGPHAQRGESAIGFADSNQDIINRVAEINGALAEEHEIGSHVNGHFIGLHWSGADWTSEFNQFNNFIFNISKNNPGIPDTVKLNITPSDMAGFRAPDLGANQNLFPVLKQFNYRYDTSLTSSENSWPKKDSNGVWEFPLAAITIGPNHSPTLSMDYNIFQHQTKVQDILKKDSPEWRANYKELYDAYIEYFNHNYYGNRAPIQIGHHFTQWNDGVYWEVMKDFAATVCGKPEVRCTTFKNLADYMDTLSPAVISQYENGQF